LNTAVPATPGNSTGRPVTFACLQNDLDPTQWQRLLRMTEECNARGGRVVPQVAARWAKPAARHRCDGAPVTRQGGI
jgi:hypothetical protein